MTALRRRIYARLPARLRGLSRTLYGHALLLLLEESSESARGPRARARSLLRAQIRRTESGPAGVPLRLAMVRWKSATRVVLQVRSLPRLMRARFAPERAAEDLFDASFYAHHYADVANSGLTPIEHYRRVGAAEGRAPNVVVDVAAYAYDHPDIEDFGGDVLLHYVRVGRPRGATLHPLFDATWYRRNNPDVGSRDPYEHFLHKGRAEGRTASAAIQAGDDIAASHTILPAASAQAARVTIIIPAFRQAALTLRCLRSVATYTSRTAGVRVIVADDDPLRPLASLLADIEGLELISNSQNLGFLRNCNNAAKRASGEYIVLLNNDTVVSAGWLDALVQTADEDDSVAVVGARLVLADGTLQEAGTIMFKNGWGYPYGRGEDPELPAYMFRRQVDAVTGVCLLVRRTAWAAAGGFDEAYAPAFYEEYDLAFRLASMGWKIMYQPAARVLHARNASYGQTLRDRQSVINHRRFVERWSDELDQRYEGPEDLFLARERPHARGAILVIDDKVPEYDKHAGALGTYQYLRLMVEEDFKVIFLADDGVARQPYTTTLQQLGIEVITGPMRIGDWFSEVAPYLSWVILSRPWVAPRYLHHIRAHSSARVLYHPRDLYWLRERRRYDATGDVEALRESERLYRIECEIFRRVDCGLTLSADELPVIEAMAPDTEIRVMTPYFYPARATPPPGETPLAERHAIIFVGAFDHLPNVDAATVLVRQVMPIVWRRLADVRVLLVGDFVPPEIKALATDRVAVLGFVPDLDTIWAQGRMSVSPIRFGAGVKGKVIHSLQAGVPAITTPMGNEGIRLAPGVEVLIGETPEEIAAHVISLFEDPDLLQALAAAGMRVIAERYSRARARADLFAALGTNPDADPRGVRVPLDPGGA